MATYSEKEIAVIAECGIRLAEILRDVARLVRPGVSTKALDTFAHDAIRNVGGTPTFLHYRGNVGLTPFPSTLCVSINNEVVHGPAYPDRILNDGDIVGIDIGMRYPAKGGLCTDTAITVEVGKVSPTASRLVAATREALARGVAAVRQDCRVRDIGEAVEKYVLSKGYSVVREYVGHGVGKHVHEEPEVPNFVVRGIIGNVVLPVGTVIAIEPMVNAGGPDIAILQDGWTVVTADHSLSAHFEQTIAVTREGVKILTPFL
ncbi:MAG: type I methionyl aminopeptidase [Patescibacteria group bacterium]|jgi:methionyl aminopeptidase